MEVSRTSKSFKDNRRLAKYYTDQQMTAKNFEEIRAMVDDYLSTKNVYWTIVESCEIAGPSRLTQA